VKKLIKRGGNLLFKKIHLFRVKPGQELVNGIESYCHKRRILSGIVIGIIGSVENARLNFLKVLPGKYDSVDYHGPLEIVCAQGSIALKDDALIIHIHIQLSGQDICSGGHLDQATVFSTAEVAIGELDYQLRRKTDSYTGLNELLD
jgi:predicted DNA-binding protein with PD1-like motif